MEDPVHEPIGVFPDDHKIHQGKDDEGVYSQPHQHGQHVVAQLGEHLPGVFHGNQFSGDKKGYSNGRIPGMNKKNRTMTMVGYYDKKV